jgi:uncharacterized protein YjbI with pentapeptide repeats
MHNKYLNKDDLSHDKIRYADLTNVDLIEVDLKNADLIEINLTNVENVELILAIANLREATLKETNLSYFEKIKGNINSHFFQQVIVFIIGFVIFGVIGGKLGIK